MAAAEAPYLILVEVDGKCQFIVGILNVIFSLYYLKPGVISSLSLVHLVLNQGWPSESRTELEAKTNIGLISKDSYFEIGPRLQEFQRLHA